MFWAATSRIARSAAIRGRSASLGTTMKCLWKWAAPTDRSERLRLPSERANQVAVAQGAQNPPHGKAGYADVLRPDGAKRNGREVEPRVTVIEEQPLRLLDHVRKRRAQAGDLVVNVAAVLFEKTFAHQVDIDA